MQKPFQHLPDRGVRRMLRRVLTGLGLLLTAACATELPTVPLAPAAKTSAGIASSPAADAGAPVITLGPGDAVTMQVFGRPEMTLTTTVAEDGTMTVPLAGSIAVTGLSPVKGAQKVAAAFRQG